MVYRDPVLGLPQFLRFLASLPAPNPVARALHLGPLLGFHAGSASIVRVEEEMLVLCGAHGYTDAEVDRYWRVPLSIPTPYSRCVLEAEVQIDDLEAVLEEFVSLQVDQDLWRGFLDRFGPGQVVSAPVILQGTVVGAFGGITTTKREWSTSDIAVLDGISSALGLWLTHPDTPVPDPDRFTGLDAAALHLTDRQLRILQLVEEGRSNTSIAHVLGYSVSTVKQELQRSMRAMRVSDRSSAAERARHLGLLTDRRTPL